MDRMAAACLCTALLLAAGIAGGGFTVEKRRLELTRLVPRQLTPDIPEERIEALAANPSLTRTIQLPHSVPFDAIYGVADGWGRFLHAYPDVYETGTR